MARNPTLTVLRELRASARTSALSERTARFTWLEAYNNSVPVPWHNRRLSHHMALASGQRIGVYEVIGPLGAGGMGEVYRARDARLGRDVALKVLPAVFAADPERLARFEREAQMLAA